ncbi:uncharacterized protein LOC117650753 [Thrips palmi]|uniref:Uncharacterized protein LOC117650753 n=1 Tax=Thrips palmi TaxID=161013 RepID=A0A6P8ZZV6_THRPL|nr:uncharacterized protein LOC117650753 [Thrips palmi]
MEQKLDTPIHSLPFLENFVQTAYGQAVSHDDVLSFLESFKGQSIFEGVGTQTELETYLKHSSGGSNVELDQVVLEYKEVLNKQGIPRRVPLKYGYVIPFLPQLEQLLNCKDVLECVDNPLPLDDELYRTVTDGLLYKYHQVTMEHGPQTLCFIIHVDDVEPCHALKSKTGKHNVRMFYWILGNIHPDKRSSLKAINLLAIVKVKVVKEFGNDHFLEDFVEGMKKLGTEGVVFNIQGVPRRFHGFLLFASADNPAAANLGGFKETMAALRPCRMCMVKSIDLNNSFLENPDLLRKLEEHNEHVRQVLSFQGKRTRRSVRHVRVVNINVDDEIEEACDIDVADEKYLDHWHPSTNFGVNGKSILSDCPGFDVTKCLAQDIMHVLAEGVVEVLCRRILKDLCFPPQRQGRRVTPLLSLDFVNKLIQSKCDLGHYETSRPSVIEASHVNGKKLRQSASQMMVLLHLMPFIVHNICPQEKLDLIIQCIKLVNLCKSYEHSKSDVSTVRIMVEHFGNSFVQVYPDVKILKLHCLAHLAMQIRLLGPLRQQACYRSESMHTKVTSVAPVVRCKKNIAFSCASRYLSERNAEIMEGKANGNFLYEGDVVKGAKAIVVSSLPQSDAFLEKYSELTESSVLFEMREVSKAGRNWYTGGVVMVEKAGADSKFGRIHKLFINEAGEIIFLCKSYVTQFVPALKVTVK